jgi:Cys-tRNA(Pro)/Cys-tRNA(Cys) deacylase
MTPAIRAAECAGIDFTLHPYEHSPDADSFGEEAAAKLGVDPLRIFKTLVAQIDRHTLVLCVIPVAFRLDLKKLAAAAGGKKADLADPADAERVTGYVVGGISPLGGRKKLPALIDEIALLHDTVFVSAGQRGLQMELTPHDLVRLTDAATADISVEK